jgi:hypothetical protein
MRIKLRSCEVFIYLILCYNHMSIYLFNYIITFYFIQYFKIFTHYSRHGNAVCGTSQNSSEVCGQANRRVCSWTGVSGVMCWMV